MASTSIAPPTHPEMRSGSFLISAGSGFSARKSLIANRPHGRSILWISLITLGLSSSGTRFSTQLLKTQSMLFSAIGVALIFEWMNSTLLTPICSAFLRASAIIFYGVDSVMRSKLGHRTGRAHLRHVYAIDPAAGSDLLAGKKDVKAAAASKVDNFLTLLRVLVNVRPW